MKPNVKVTIGETDRLGLGGDVVTVEDMREFLVAYLEYEPQMLVANEDGGDRVIARRRELVDSATQMMVADEFYDGKLWIDLSEQELKKGLKIFAGVDVQQTRDVEFLPPGLPCAEDGCERAGRQQSVQATACPAKIRC